MNVIRIERKEQTILKPVHYASDSCEAQTAVHADNLAPINQAGVPAEGGVCKNENPPANVLRKQKMPSQHHEHSGLLSRGDPGWVSGQGMI